MNIQTKKNTITTGFSLVELLVAMGISMIVVLAALSMMVAAHNAYQVEEEQGYVQQVARAATDFIAADLLRAGLGCRDQSKEDVDEDYEFAFPPKSVNNSNAPDVLFFQGSMGGVTYNQNPASITSGSSVSFSVVPGSLRMFHTNDEVIIYSLDKEILAEGVITGLSDTESGASMDINITSTKDDMPVNVDTNSAIMQKPQYIMYAVNKPAGSATGTLVRCVANNYDDIDACPCSGACTTFEIADDVENFQVSVLIDGVNNWQTDFDWDENTDLNNNGIPDLKEIVAVKVDLLVRGPAYFDDYRDTTTYIMGDVTFTPTDDAQHYLRELMTTVVQLKNVKN